MLVGVKYTPSGAHKTQRTVMSFSPPPASTELQSFGSAARSDDATAARRAADKQVHAAKHISHAGTLRQTADVLLAVLHERDPDLSQHLHDVAALAQMTATELGLPEEQIAQIRLAAQLHDIGKVAIPDAILNKPAALDAADWRAIEQHTVIGQRIAAAAPALAPVADVIRSSHERYDGGGYPDGLAGGDIPLGSQVVFVCDSFHAMTTDRPYRKAMSATDATEELRRHADSQFNSVVVDAFTASYASRARVAPTADAACAA